MVFAILGSILLVATLGTLVGLALIVRTLWRRLQSLERRLVERPQRALPHDASPLQGLRFALDVRQDHPNPVFADLLRDALAQEGAVPGGGLLIRGEIVGNGYADVYFRADLACLVGDETLFVLSDKPPHGDRPANLALEVVQRLKTEWPKRERRAAMRELGEG